MLAEACWIDRRLSWCLCSAAFAVSCMPQHDLSTYAAGVAIPVDLSARVGALPDAGVLDVALAADALDAGSDAGEISDGAIPRAADAGSVCRPDCECESRAGQVFMFCTSTVSRDLARQRCDEAGGGLVSIESAPLNDWLDQRMGALATDDYWTGGSDLASEGTWRWGDGRVYDAPNGQAPLPFTAWNEEQPNGGRNENCMRSIDGLWRDLPCADAAAFVCEF
jgi:Lectin C-type domain